MEREPHLVPVNPNTRKRPRFLDYKGLTGVKFSGKFGRKIKKLGKGYELLNIEHYGYCVVTTLVVANTRRTSSLVSRLKYEDQNMDTEEAHEANESEQMRNARRELFCTPEVARHPNIVDFYGFHKSGNQTIGLVLEYMRGGSIYDIINRDPMDPIPVGALGKDDLTMERIILYSLHLARALAFLHDNLNIVHRNIKTSNVFLSWDNRVAKLGEFCFARIDDKEDGPMTANKYPVKYSPPEVLNNSPRESYGKKADVYSFAITVNAMTQKREPFEGEEVVSTSAFRDELMRGYRPEIEDESVIHPDLLWVIKNGWEAEEGRRPSMIDIVRKLEPFVPPGAEYRV